MIPQFDFYHALAVTLHAVPDNKPTMPALQCLLIEFVGEAEMRLVGSDGERIVVTSLAVEHQQPVGSSFRMSPLDVRVMLGVFPADVPAAPDGMVTLAVFGDTFIATAGEACATAERVDLPEYPDYRKVMTYNECAVDTRPFYLQYLQEALAALAHIGESVWVHINGLRGPGYIDAAVSDRFTAIEAVRVGISARAVAAPVEG